MRELDPIKGQPSWHRAIGLLIELRPVRRIILFAGYSISRFIQSPV